MTGDPILARAFAPHEALATSILEKLDLAPSGSDGSHDRSHLMRVWRIVSEIASEEQSADTELLAAATLLHDCVSVEKNDPRRSHASRLSADVAREVLDALGWPQARIDAVAHAIEAHSFSAGIAPRSPEAAILRDADRLDSLGALGIARTFYIAGRLGSQLYAEADPLARSRVLDDSRFAFDHFEAKLFRLEDGLLTTAGKRIGAQRAAFLRAFAEEFAREIGTG